MTLTNRIVLACSNYLIRKPDICRNVFESLSSRVLLFSSRRYPLRSMWVSPNIFFLFRASMILARRSSICLWVIAVKGVNQYESMMLIMQLNLVVVLIEILHFHEIFPKLIEMLAIQRKSHTLSDEFLDDSYHGCSSWLITS